MNRTLTTLLAAAMLALAGCGGSEPAADPAPADPAPAAEAPAANEAPAAAEAPASNADALVTLATAIRANPGDADKLLSEAGMTLEEFEAAMFELAKDPAKAAAFASALQ